MPYKTHKTKTKKINDWQEVGRVLTEIRTHINNTVTILNEPKLSLPLQGFFS